MRKLLLAAAGVIIVGAIGFLVVYKPLHINSTALAPVEAVAPKSETIEPQAAAVEGTKVDPAPAQSEPVSPTQTAQPAPAAPAPIAISDQGKPANNAKAQVKTKHHKATGAQ